MQRYNKFSEQRKEIRIIGMIPGIFSVIACFIKGKCVPLSPNYKDLRQCTIKVHQSKYNMTMKKEIYLKPSMQVLEVEPIQIVMTCGFKASRKAYGDAIEQTWEVVSLGAPLRRSMGSTDDDEDFLEVIRISLMNN